MAIVCGLLRVGKGKNHAARSAQQRLELGFLKTTVPFVLGSLYHEFLVLVLHVGTKSLRRTVLHVLGESPQTLLGAGEGKGAV